MWTVGAAPSCCHHLCNFSSLPAHTRIEFLPLQQRTRSCAATSGCRATLGIQYNTEKPVLAFVAILVNRSGIRFNTQKHRHNPKANLRQLLDAIWPFICNLSNVVYCSLVPRTSSPGSVFLLQITIFKANLALIVRTIQVEPHEKKRSSARPVALVCAPLWARPKLLLTNPAYNLRSSYPSHLTSLIDDMDVYTPISNTSWPEECTNTTLSSPSTRVSQ